MTSEATTATTAVVVSARIGVKRRESALKKLLRNRVTLAGLVVVVAVTLAAVLAPVLAPYSYDTVSVKEKLLEPSARQWLGTDQFGRDILSRILYGAQVSLVVGVAGMFVALAAGVAIGAAAGYYGGWLDEALMRSMDVIMAFPYIVLGVAMAAVVGPSFQNLIFIIGVIRVPQFARITRGAVLSIRSADFVEAARCLGQRPTIILVKHILPNCITPVVVLASLSVATAISAEAALSFLGLGVQPPMASWGTMLADGRQYMYNAPWIATFPGLAISITILGYNLFGDGLRDVLDPRLR